MQADSGDPRCQHQAMQTTSEGQPWQEGITSTRDLQNVLHCGVRSSCNVCRTCGTCCMPHLPDIWYQATYILHTVPPTAPICTLLVETTALPMTQHAKDVEKKGHWQAKCQSCNTPSPQASHWQPHSKIMKRERITICESQNREKTPHKDLFIAAMDCGTVGDMHPKEMIIDNISSQQCNEAYTVIKLPASASSKGTTSIWVKIDTGYGGNILPLHLFQQLHPKQTSPDGLPIGLDPIQTKPTAYNGSLIPLYGILCGPILWQPNTPGAQPCMIHSYWYITDTPGPALLGLPTCEKLAVVQVSCAVGPTQSDRSLIGTAPTQAARPPTARTLKSNCIKSTDDLTREFSNRFTEIGKFPDEYKIQLHPDAHLVIHAHRKCPIALHPKVKEHLAKMEALGVITHIDQPTDWVLSITYIQKANGELCLCLDLHDLNRAICHNHHKMPTVEEVTHKFANLCYFTKLDTHHGYWSIVLDEESNLLTTFNSPFGRYHFLHLPFGLVCSQHIFQKKMDQFLKKCPGCIRITDSITVHGHTEAEHDAHLQNLMQVAHKYGVVFNPQKMHVKAQAIKFFGCLYDANGVHPDPEKVDAVHALPAPMNVTKFQEFLGIVTYFSPLCPWPVHPDCPSVRTPEKRCWLHLECQLWGCFWANQASCHQQHHPQILWPITACDHTSPCFPGRSKCSTPTEQQAYSFSKQSTHWCRMQICKHRERNASSCLWSREIPHLCLWTVLHNRIRP